MLDDYQGAVELAKKYGLTNLAKLWEESLDAVTTPNATVTSYSTTPHLLWKLNKQEKNNDISTVIGWIADIAAGAYGILTWFDPWGAYTAERERFVTAMKPAGGNAVVYSGDTHAAFAGMLRNDAGQYFGAEFSCPGVTSPDSEWGALVPLELINAAQLVSDHVWKDTRYKGFQYVTLTHEEHHVDFVIVPWGSPDYTAACDYAFDLPSAHDNARYKAKKTAKDVMHSLPVAVWEKEINPLGKNANRPPLHIVECSKLPEAKPYMIERPGISGTLSPAHLIKTINTVDVY